MPDYRANWAAQTAKLDRAEKAKARKAKQKAKAIATGKPALPLEKDIQKAIMQALRTKGVLLYIADAGVAGFRGAGMPDGMKGYSSLPRGFPDLIGVAPGGRFLAIEVKRPPNKPTKFQSAFLALFRSKGAIAFWADSVDDAIKKYAEATNGA